VNRGAAFEFESAYDCSGFFVVRSALLPFREFAEWNAGLETADPSRELGPEAWFRARRAELLARLRRAFSRPELAEALFVASPELAQRLPEWLAAHEPDPKLDRTFVRYFARAAGRATPFGLFAGISLGCVGTVDAFRLEGLGGYYRRARLGMGALVRCLNALAAREEVRARLRYAPTSSLYRACGRIRFASLELDAELARAKAYPVVDVEPSPALEAALARAREGATLVEIAAAVSGPGIEPAEALDYARQLVESELLVPAWIPPVSGAEPRPAAIATLLERAGLTGEATEVEAMGHALETLDGQPVGRGGAVLAEVEGRSFWRDIPRPERFKTDLVKPAEHLSLGPATRSLLLEAAKLVQRTSGAYRDARLDEFRRRFEARYEGRFVPLMEALDADLGIGYDRLESEPRRELFDDLPLERTESTGSVFDRYDSVRLRILTRALRDGATTLELDKETLASFPQRPAEPLPESFAVMAQLGRAANGALFVVAPLLIAPSAVATLARFCHAEPELERRVRQHVTLEQALAGDEVLADVAHLPNAHVANIVLRPVLRDYEIVYQGSSGAPAERQILLDDLYVGVDADRVVLRSRRLGRRVRVRITNAHNFEGWWNLPLYRFFGALQNQDHGALAGGWTWGALIGSPFLPRIVTGNVVLSRAQWTVSSRDFEPVRRSKADAAFAAMLRLRERLHLPRWVTLADTDQHLPIDLDNVLAVEMLLHEVRERPEFVLEELMPAPGELLVSGPEGTFAAEVVVPFVRRPAAAVPADGILHRAPRLSLEWAARSLPPGSDWLYVKLYAGRSQHSTVLNAARLALATTPFGATLPLWYFLPFADPDPHLRFRVQGDPRILLEQVLPALEQALRPLFKQGLVRRIQLDTYEREVERYGGPQGVALSERLFAADSEAVCALRALGEDDDVLSWQLTLMGIDRLFVDFGLELEARAALARSMADDYGAELGANAATWKKVGEKQRAHAGRLETLLFHAAASADAWLVTADAILAQRSRALSPVRAAIEQAATAGELTVDGETLLRSFAHLHAVRMLGDSARVYELVLCDMLRRQYTAHAAKLRTPAKRPQ
jgi:lantibiotic biosynthesis protein